MKLIKQLEQYLEDPYQFISSEKVGAFNVFTIPTPNNIKLSRIAFVFGGGAMADVAHGEIHFLEHLVLNGGEQIENVVEYNGGSWMRGLTSLTSTTYGFDAANSADFKSSLNHYVTKLFHENLLQQDLLEYERGRIISEYYEEFPSAQIYKFEKMKMNFFFGNTLVGNTLSPIGTMETITSLNLERAQELKAQYCYPENCSILFMGNEQDYDELCKLILSIKTTGRDALQKKTVRLTGRTKTSKRKVAHLKNMRALIAISNFSQIIKKEAVAIVAQIINKRIEKATNHKLYSFDVEYGDLRGAGSDWSIKIFFSHTNTEEIWEDIQKALFVEITEDELDIAIKFLQREESYYENFPNLNTVFGYVLEKIKTGQPLLNPNYDIPKQLVQKTLSQFLQRTRVLYIN